MATLATAVVVHVPAGPVWCPAGSCPAPEVAALITAPGAWVGGVCPVPDNDDSVKEPVEPPRAGRGSSRAAWSAYASAIGVDVADSASRDDIIADIDSRRDGDEFES